VLVVLLVLVLSSILLVLVLVIDLNAERGQQAEGWPGTVKQKGAKSI
jgi:hypothetical protein